MVHSLTQSSHEPAGMVCQSTKRPQAVGKLLVSEPREQPCQMRHDSMKICSWVVSQSGKRPHDVDQALLRRVVQPLGLRHLCLYQLQRMCSKCSCTARLEQANGWTIRILRFSCIGPVIMLSAHSMMLVNVVAPLPCNSLLCSSQAMYPRLIAGRHT